MKSPRKSTRPPSGGNGGGAATGRAKAPNVTRLNPKGAEVQKFPRAYRAPMDPEPAVIRHCERLLADAKAGRLRSLVYATVHRDDLSHAGMVDHGWAAGAGTYYAITHAIERLSRGWGRECDRDCDDRHFDKPPGSAA